MCSQLGIHADAGIEQTIQTRAHVALDNGRTVMGASRHRMAFHRVNVILSDRVEVAVSRYNLD
jgi:translation initiation factor IF-1